MRRRGRGQHWPENPMPQSSHSRQAAWGRLRSRQCRNEGKIGGRPIADDYVSRLFSLVTEQGSFSGKIPFAANGRKLGGLYLATAAFAETCHGVVRRVSRQLAGSEFPEGRKTSVSFHCSEVAVRGRPLSSSTNLHYRERESNLHGARNGGNQRAVPRIRRQRDWQVTADQILRRYLQ
jgi:hypothetical protein